MTDPKSLRSTILRDRNFRWLLSGGIVSGLGDQFTMIALPWLVLTMTGDPLALGLVIATMSVPRALFMLVGGALVDRYSPKRVMMLTKYANAALLGVLAALILFAPNMLPLALLYALALGLGVAQAFAIPSGTSIMPQVVAPEHLQAANGLMMGLRQITMLAGPVLAALLIAIAGDGSASANAGTAHAPHDTTVAPMGALGIGLAFAFDCFSFLLSAWTLSQVRPHATASAAAQQGQAIFSSVAEGLLTVWRDVALRTCFGYWSIVAVLVGGAMQVALPLLASRNLHGAAALGVLMGANGLGSLCGMALSGAGVKLRLGALGTTILAIDALVGILLAPLGNITAVWQGAALLLAVGVLSGFMQIAVFTWIQRSVPPRMLGRAMSIFMFIFMGLAPLSAAVIGWLLQYISLPQLFTGGGAMLVAIALLAYLLTPMRTIRSA